MSSGGPGRSGTVKMPQKGDTVEVYVGMGAEWESAVVESVRTYPVSWGPWSSEGITVLARVGDSVVRRSGDDRKGYSWRWPK